MSIAIFHLSNPYPSKCYKTTEHLFRLSPRQTLFRSRYERFRGKFSNFAAKQTLTMEQKFGKNSIDIKVLREFCEREGKMVEYRKGERYELLLQRCPGIVEHLALQDIASFLNVTPKTISMIRKDITFGKD